MFKARDNLLPAGNIQKRFSEREGGEKKEKKILKLPENFKTPRCSKKLYSRGIERYSANNKVCLY